jgi:hypothetical protein
MNPNKTITGYTEKPPFIHFIVHDRINRRLLSIASIAAMVQFILFKSLYPFGDYFSDSYSYIYAAFANLNISIWPIGYSKFLLAFHQLTHSNTALVAFQYLLLVLSNLYFFYSILYFFNPRRLTRVILFIFLFFNPLSLYISNYVNSDPLFASLSIFWITELLWVISRPRPYQILTQAVLLFLCFTVRNNAYYYPLVATVAFMLSRQKFFFKVYGILLPALFLVPFIIYTRNAAEEMTGTKQFSLFTGWQLANNALYMYKHIEVDSSRLPSQSCRELDRLSRTFFSHVPANFDDFLLNWEANFFIQYSRSPLKQYISRNYKAKDETEYVANWGKVSVVYGQYGEWLIKNHPVAYVKCFMMTNAEHFFLPSLEKLALYNRGEDSVEKIAQSWFDYKSPAVHAISKTAQSYILLIYPYIFFFLNVLALGGVIWLMIKRQLFKLPRIYYTILLLTGILIIANFCFCIGVTIVVMRYQFFPMLMTLVFSMMILEYLEQQELSIWSKPAEIGKKEINPQLSSA